MMSKHCNLILQQFIETGNKLNNNDFSISVLNYIYRVNIIYIKVLYKIVTYKN